MFSNLSQLFPQYKIKGFGYGTINFWNCYFKPELLFKRLYREILGFFFFSSKSMGESLKFNHFAIAINRNMVHWTVSSAIVVSYFNLFSTVALVTWFTSTQYLYFPTVKLLGDRFWRTQSRSEYYLWIN